MDYYIYIIIAILISIFLSQTRSTEKNINTIIATNISWLIVVYAVILGFSIGNFYNKYIAIRDTFLKEATNIKLTYKMFKLLPDSEYVILSIEKYILSINTLLVKSLSNYEYSIESNRLYEEMNNNILKYSKDHPNVVFNNNILIRMSTDEFIKQLVNEMKIGNYYINLLWFLLIFIILPLWFITLYDKVLQFFLDFCLMVFFITGIYICTTLNNPFIYSPFGLKLDIFNNLL